jgi:ectoine hydroxylase-related dioxygenase (phytanoyl-CoA dioxygenase family)
MSVLFKSEALQTQFETDGFVNISLLNVNQVEALNEAYLPFKEAHEKIKLPYITTSHSSNATLITAVDEVLQSVLAPEIDKLLTNYKLLFGNYLVKMPVPHSETDPHQDITFVDESQYVSANIWIALQDIDEKNGGMYFLKGSHKFMPTIRPTHHYHWPYENVKQQIIEQSTAFSAKAGDAFIFNHAVIHGSTANTSNTPRLAAVIAAYSKEAPLIHYYLPNIDSSLLKKYAMNKEAYLSFEKEKPPMRGVFIGEEEFDFTVLSPNAFAKMAQPNSLSFFERIKTFFKQ